MYSKHVRGFIVSAEKDRARTPPTQHWAGGDSPRGPPLWPIAKECGWQKWTAQTAWDGQGALPSPTPPPTPR